MVVLFVATCADQEDIEKVLNTMKCCILTTYSRRASDDVDGSLSDADAGLLLQRLVTLTVTAVGTLCEL